MPPINPDNLQTAFAQLLDAATKAGADGSRQLTDLFDQVGTLTDDVRDLPDTAKERLKQITDNPDWWSLLVFLLVRIAELDHDHMRVGARKPPGWVRTLTLTYTPEGPAPAATLGLAIVGDESDPTLKRGLLLDITQALDVSIPQQDSMFGLTLKADGTCGWVFEFGSPPTPPDGDVSVDIGLFYDGLPDLGRSPAAVTTGRARLTLALNSTPAPSEKCYSLTAGLGSPNTAADAGVRAHVDFGSMLGILGTVIDIRTIDEQYSPAYTLPASGEPSFVLNHRGT
ncbi:hypothetical protein GII33_06135 [Gordonia pseudamarae]|jgi:hypothetical protein|uniref:Uncharacterized protein n=1 Tax=Gordonia pseudamarae TaxID=2831662 RepID=A0ABX6IH06_9ACTN|nr:MULTISPECIES: hypothetical protein [Gordonia]MBD0020564.1 hypothetical protein [Gordonia sp. (in: high G+C Gram-positive bacteria)]QHN25607.1 hypothetical protein GII33_06135 [Gordonia pseudamarae]QHN34540.1 hypothetical protein GII31_06115 [Gordonia pseudamarae]